MGRIIPHRWKIKKMFETTNQIIIIIHPIIDPFYYPINI